MCKNKDKKTVIKQSNLITSITKLYNNDFKKYDCNLTSIGNKKMRSASFINVRIFVRVKRNVTNRDKITSTDICGDTELMNK
ncbi:putative ABC transporter permease protein [Bacillus sp. TS-2]|nr:putative ABC transporter permease protein [Bacillus sp. TS-2]